MKSVEKRWFEAVPWESLVDINRALCQAQQIEQVTNARSLALAKELWDGAVKKAMSLPDALEACRKCHDAGPFVFNNGNTFGSVARTLIQDWLKSLPPLEAEIVRATVSHYVVGLVGKRELFDILKHFEPVLRKTAPAPVKLAETPVAEPGTRNSNPAPIQTASASQAV